MSVIAGMLRRHQRLIYTWLMSRITRGGLVVRTTDGRAWPLTLSVGEYRQLTGTKKTAQAIRDDLEKGRIPAKPRKARSG